MSSEPQLNFTLLVSTKNLQILGISIVSVTKGATVGHVFSYMSECKKSLVLFNCLPCRLSRIHFINPPLVA